MFGDLFAPSLELFFSNVTYINPLRASAEQIL